MSDTNSARPAPSRFLALVLVAVITAASATVAQLHARPLQPVAVVFPPWWSHEAAFAASAQPGIAVIAAGPTSNVIIVEARDLGALVKLYGMGAWGLLSLDATPDCLPRGPRA